MIDASAELVAAIRTALISDPVLAGIVGDRVTADWGLDLQAPFIRLFVPRSEPWDDHCHSGMLYTVTVNIFVRETGVGVIRARISDRVRAVLKDEAVLPATSDLWWIEAVGTEYGTDAADPELKTARCEYEAGTTDRVGA